MQVSDTLQFFSVGGPDASEIISITSAIDHHYSVVPSNGVSYTEIFGMKGLLIRKGEDWKSVSNAVLEIWAGFLLCAK